jgi:hypothetical protein
MHLRPETLVLSRSGDDTTSSPPPIHSVKDWIHIFHTHTHTHTHEEFSDSATRYKDDTCQSCMGVSGAAMLRPSSIQRNTYGN